MTIRSILARGMLPPPYVGKYKIITACITRLTLRRRIVNLVKTMHQLQIVWHYDNSLAGFYVILIEDQWALCRIPSKVRVLQSPDHEIF